MSSISCLRFSDRVYDVSRGRCHHRKYPTVFDLVKCKNPTVFNCFIDHKG